MMKRSLFSFFIVLALTVFPLSAGAQSASDIMAYVAQYKDIALTEEREFGIPAPITLAQGILESGAGKSGLTCSSNNHFGVKALGGWNGAVHLAWDDEPQKSRFRVYASAAESFRDHSLVLARSSRYRPLFSKSIYDYRGWAIGLQRAGYATATNYASALIGFIETYHLYAINGGVKLRPGRTVIVTHTAQQQPTFDDSCVMADDEQTEEEQAVQAAVQRYVVDINDVSCTLLYPGMTLANIAMKYDISQQKLLEYNEVTSASDIHEGDIVFLDKKKKKYTGARDYYYAREGDTLYSISQQFGIRIANLARMNDIDLFTRINPGMKLNLK